MWNKKRNIQETLDILEQLSGICAHNGNSLSKELYSLVKESRFLELIEFEFDYTSLVAAGYSSNDILFARQIQAFYSKLEEIDLGLDKQLEAAKKFAEAEGDCLWTNRRLRYAMAHSNALSEPVSVVLYYASRKISAILGRLPSLEELQFSFGPGANTSVKGAVACPRVKLSASLECSYELSPTVAELLSEAPHWTALHSHREVDDFYYVHVTVAPGKLVFVPKNAKTARSIMVEPILNSFAQKGIGLYMKKRLALAGVDLRDQSRNQSLACEGSLTGELATLDLSSASDCMSTELVWNLLPYEWADFLSRFRTGTVKLPDIFSSVEMPEGLSLHNGELRLEKFSSMGNAFTFELESLIFYALAHSVCRYLHISTKDVSVYGDDIIIPRTAHKLMEEVLEAAGFTVNRKKSFASGPFRESCGSDFLSGLDIRPYYQKSLISDQSLYSMHNWFLRHGERELAACAKSFCNHDELLYGPDGYGDGHLIGDWLPRLNRRTSRHGLGGGFFDTYVLKERRITRPFPGDSVLPHYSVYTRSGEASATDPDVVRGSCGYAKISIYTLSVSVLRRY